MAGDLAGPDLRRAQADPAAFFGDIQRELIDEAPPPAVVRDGCRAPEVSAVKPQLGRGEFAREEADWLQRDLRARGGEDFSRQSGERDGDIVGREREVREYPKGARAEFDALGGEPLRERLGDEGRQSHRPVMIGEPGQPELHREKEQQAGVRQPAEEATQR